jgi:hypothetical protein
VRIYTWGASSWVQAGADIDGEAERDSSGSSVSLSADGQTVAVGAYTNDGAGSNAGHVRVTTASSDRPKAPTAPMTQFNILDAGGPHRFKVSTEGAGGGWALSSSFWST